MENKKFKKRDKVLVKSPLIKEPVQSVIVEVSFDETHNRYLYRCKPLKNSSVDVHFKCGVIDFKDVQLLNAASPISVTPLFIVTDVKDVQAQNA